ncbi:hypothetical protein [Streptomyces sp. AD55]|uniref:hypothetical protein n=1 Tax=Streptomyces sp. AD55 TaxID=3242895 RepID=UPI003527B596
MTRTMHATPTPRTRPAAHRAHGSGRALAVTVLLAATALGCSGSGGDGSEGAAAPSAAAPGASADGPAGGDSSATARIAQVNATMSETPFSAIGTTTAFDAGLQHLRWNPAQGLHIDLVGTTGDMYCKDGVTYTASGLLAESLKTKGVDITVPDRLKDTYVSTETGQGCEAYFTVPPGSYAPERDTDVEGVAARAVVASAGATSDVYYLSEEDPARLLRMESTRDGRESKTTYTDFGKAADITVPRGDRVMTMDEFRAQVGAG